jgi:(1->4)-alpha-D-glucan 1-alpha-D-glucosylmutase
VQRLTERLHERADRFPRSLNATNTHDTKRSADARSRIDALSEHPTDWQRSLRKWRRTQRDLRRRIGGRLVPGAPNDDFAYQALLAVWPLTVAVPSNDGWLTEIQDRLTAYLLKANREAKVNTSWTNPDVPFEEALTRFIDGLLDPAQGAAFHQDVVRFVEQLAPQALWNTLGRVVLHLMAPGVPDIYQGDEIWYAALVDPDNRRPVDWEARTLALAEARAFAAAPDRERRLAEFRDQMRASELKMFILSELLALRSQIDELNGASFHPLQVEGPRREHIFAVERECANGTRVAVLVARQTGALPWPQAGQVWRDMWVRWSSNKEEEVQRVIHGGRIRVADGAIRVADALSSVPVEVLVTLPQ